jgi:glycosyltransferase involved in cell wall biosynthesis
MYEKFKSFNFFKDKLVQLYHGYDYTEIAAARLKPRYDGQKYIVFVGRLEKIKGAHTVLKAMIAHPEIQLKIIGTGTQEEELKQFKMDNHLDQVTFSGKKSKQETLQIISGAEFLICASEWYEVLGFTVVEAMALGKPVIGSAIGAIPEMVIDGYTGLLFEPGNAHQLAEKIQQLYANQELKGLMGKNAHLHINQLINNDTHYSGLQKLIPGL